MGTNTFFIGCDICEKWYHGKCVRINEEFAKFVDKYFCFRCMNNKTPAQGKCILKNHLMGNNEIYINPLDLNDPNMYYGYNPNKDAITSRQKKLESNKLKKRAEIIENLSKKLQININEQEDLRNELDELNLQIKRSNEELNKELNDELREENKAKNVDEKNDKQKDIKLSNVTKKRKTRSTSKLIETAKTSYKRDKKDKTNKKDLLNKLDKKDFVDNLDKKVNLDKKNKEPKNERNKEQNNEKDEKWTKNDLLNKKQIL